MEHGRQWPEISETTGQAMSNLPVPAGGGEFLLYQTEDGQTRVQVRVVDETVWLTQRQMAELFEKDVRTVNEHIGNVFEEGELKPEATIRKFRIVQICHSSQ
jgi:hypothetical protein